ncbi:MAG: hypothetical protein F6K50_46730 [Moorea sp. SIO3I7]|uniref:hypothetical protein n=1 Tax=unclassified Moorena TaxID=2683338 RepID=UPI0013CA1464|nr:MULTISPECIES: hypothetical protein [unclassified Moorena]NEO02581.1 hypothetical protein [Moorena sp. SIO3I7]NEO64107.1 hypothetical protein [Moorena sp. SIO4G2]NEO16556.1 hypothetical protein [Moorena sp. SIO3E8]NEQ03086.1 hypothetical protein [Moorena sp. SIO3F7]NEQ63331.1 hypothetical protein [Moorena sp. SIO4A1]
MRSRTSYYRYSRDKDNPPGQGLIDLAETIAQLQQTNLQYAHRIIQVRSPDLVGWANRHHT